MEISYNRKAKHDYEILDSLDAGIELTGHEAKSAKLGRFNLVGSYVIFQNDEALLFGSDIPSFQPKNAPEGYDSGRTRKLLLKKKEIDYLRGKKESGLTIVPVRAFIKNNLIKVTVAVGRGRKKHDKRELIKKRETDRKIRRRMSQ